MVSLPIRLQYESYDILVSVQEALYPTLRKNDLDVTVMYGPS